MKLTIVKILCGLSAFSLLLYAFTGLTLWSQLESDGQGLMRGMLLAGMHLVPLLAWALMEIDK